MRKWAPVLHFYQPPTQDLQITNTVYQTSYLPFLNVLLDNPHIKVTLNINGSLVLQFEELKLDSFFSKMHTLLKRNQIEFVNTAMYHPLLPLTDFSIVHRQLSHNRNIIKQYFHTDTVNGIFPPELAVDLQTLEMINNHYDFALIDESSVLENFESQEIIPNPFYKLKNLTLVASSRILTEVLRATPYEIDGDAFVNFILNQSQPNQSIISVNDVELFGHHYQHRFSLLQKVFDCPDIELVHISEIITDAPVQHLEPTDIIASSWSTTEQDQQDTIPFPLWKHPHNELQDRYHQLTALALEYFQSIPEPANDDGLTYAAAQNHLDIGTSSCHTYWLSNWPWWHPDLAEKGAINLIRCIRSLPVGTEQKLHGEEVFSDLLKALWTYHWKGEQFEQFKAFDNWRNQFLKTLPELQ